MKSADRDGVALGQENHGLDRGEQVLGAVVDLGGQQSLAFFRALALRDVTHDPGEVPLALEAEFADRQGQRELRSVPAPARQLAADADDPRLAGAQIARQVLVVARAVRRRHQDPHVLADQLVLPVAEQPRRLGIHGLDQAARIDRDDAVGGIVHHRPQRASLASSAVRRCSRVLAISLKLAASSRSSGLPRSVLARADRSPPPSGPRPVAGPRPGARSSLAADQSDDGGQREGERRPRRLAPELAIGRAIGLLPRQSYHREQIGRAKKRRKAVQPFDAIDADGFHHALTLRQHAFAEEPPRAAAVRSTRAPAAPERAARRRHRADLIVPPLGSAVADRSLDSRPRLKARTTTARTSPAESSAG